MKKKAIFLCFVLIVFLISTASSAHAVIIEFGTINGYTVTAYGYSEYQADTAAMDAAFGITGLVIEDFEDASLIPNLSMSTGYLSYDSNANWDGRGVWRNSVPITDGRDIDFAFSHGANKFGVGLGTFEYERWLTNVDLYVNDTLLVEDIYYRTGFSRVYYESYRNMYIVVEKDTGEVIDNVTLKMSIGQYYNGIHYDGVTFDHVAVDPVPEPTTMLLLGTGLLGLAAARRKMKK